MTPRPHLWSPLLLALAPSLVACGGGSFRVVDVAPSGGELALHGDRDEAHAEADSYMSRHCPSGRDVLRDGIAVVGSLPASTMTGYGVRLESPRADLVEWRLRYRCSGRAESQERPPAEGPPSAQSAPAQQPPASAPAPAPSPDAPEPSTEPPPNNWF